MKIKSFLAVLFLMCIGLFFSNRAFAYLLDEQILKTRTGQCQIRYLTQKNTKGWYVETERNECGADGWLDGYHNIVVYNAFSKPIEKLYGYFSKGYWTGDAWIEAPLLTRSSEELGVQKATFHVAQDKENEIDFIGQMTANRGADGTYSGFNVCNPFRLLAVTNQFDLFDDPHSRQQIFKETEKYVRRFCPAEKRIMLFVSPVVEPEQDDIVFYADVDLQGHTSEIVWQNEAKERRSVVRRVERMSSESILQHRKQREAADLESVRQDVYKKIRQITPNDDSAQPERIIISEKSYQPEPNEPTFSVGSRPIKKPDYVIQGVEDDLTADAGVLKEKDATYQQQQKEAEEYKPIASVGSLRRIKYISDETAIEAKQETESLSVSSRKSIQRKTDKADSVQTDEFDDMAEEMPHEPQEQGKLQTVSIEPAAHLLVLSKVKKQPVLGKAIVHVSQSGSKSNAIADVPFALDLQGKRLNRGWYIISGYFDGSSKTSKQTPLTRGTVRLLKTISCKTEFCQDKL